MSGRSGAEFLVLKYSEDKQVRRRLKAQHQWFLDHPSPSLPRVRNWTGQGYEMELLQPSDADLATRLVTIGRILANDVWQKPAEPIDWCQHLERLAKRGAPDWLIELGARLGSAPQSCDTHGDPTAENLLVRPDTGQFVLTDPVPDASIGTGERAADLGKMLQSAVGYEELRRDPTGSSLWAMPEVDVVRALARDADEWTRARYWLGVWLVAIRAYQTPEMAWRLTEELENMKWFVVGRPAVFLDRDGTLNATVDGVPPRSTAQLQVLGSVEEACRLLRDCGYALIIVTNQSELAYGTLDRVDVDLVNETVRRLVEAEAVFTCPHGRNEGCTCRKPAPGMLLEASQLLDIDLTSSWIIGDKEADVGAGEAAGLRGSILLPRDEDGALLRVVKETVLA